MKSELSRTIGLFTICLVLILFSCQNEEANGQEELQTERLAPPPLEGHVADLGAVMNEDQISALEEQLRKYQAENGNRYLVYTEPSLPGTLDNMVERLERRTSVGQPGLNNGAAIVLAKSERQVKLELNHGLEWQIPQFVVDEIFGKMVQRYLKNDQFYEAFSFAFDTLHQISSQVPWEISYQGFDQLSQAGEAAVGQIARFSATIETRNGFPRASEQFSPEYFLMLKSQEKSVKVYYSFNMDKLVEFLSQEGREHQVFARIRSVDPNLELELLGAL